MTEELFSLLLFEFFAALYVQVRKLEVTSSPSATTAAAGFMCSAVVIGIVGNILVCLAFVLNRHLRLVLNYFIISLAVSDFLVALFGMPCYVMVLPGFIALNNITNRLWLTFDIFVAAASVVNLPVMSLERGSAVCYPLRHMVWITPKNSFSDY